ncbi:selenium cofactor biosynthesis protein YqeC [Oscillibacter sp.]|uniref:selenium cofactor biosynthesis protein YqeC n=1 Tax=Oscillibacter sp. TaxID=1945593 RepID=UPI00262541D6|nr:selenium cofactor biosynthesis protein YqeC [Oscillibacter sp.]MDD3346587.1 selenium cofactor biosynthesis protein YqeC [Oscillibacter sp.]
MYLFDALGLPQRGSASLVGGGGKSTLLRCLTEEVAGASRSAVAVTTTRITRAQGAAAGVLVLSGGAAALEAALKIRRAVCAGTLCQDGKLGPPEPEVLAAAYSLADWVLAEADGARRLPVKAPADHEPVLLPGGFVIAVAGVSALGRPLCEICHRWELAAKALDVSPEERLTPQMLARLLTSERGQYKGVADPARFRVLLNQADAAPEGAVETARAVRRALPGCRVVTAALRERNGIREVFI